MTLPRPVSATCLGQLLIAAGMLGRATLDTALDRQRLRNRRLGELLVEMGVLDAPDLNAVLVLQDDLRGGRAGELAGLIGGRLGIILLCSATITRAQLDRAIEEHEGSGMMLGQVLVAHGAISRAQLEHALDCQHQKPELRPDRYKLGRMLVAERFITQAQLDEALSRQAASTQRLGDVLIQAGVLAPSRLLEALARQRHLISAAVAGFTLAATLASAFPQAMMAAAVI
jgi:hypothetical protein